MLLLSDTKPAWLCQRRQRRWQSTMTPQRGEGTIPRAQASGCCNLFKQSSRLCRRRQRRPQSTMTPPKEAAHNPQGQATQAGGTIESPTSDASLHSVVLQSQPASPPNCGTASQHLVELCCHEFLGLPTKAWEQIEVCDPTGPASKWASPLLPCCRCLHALLERKDNPAQVGFVAELTSPVQVCQIPLVLQRLLMITEPIPQDHPADAAGRLRLVALACLQDASPEGLPMMGHQSLHPQN